MCAPVTVTAFMSIVLRFSNIDVEEGQQAGDGGRISIIARFKDYLFQEDLGLGREISLYMMHALS